MANVHNIYVGDQIVTRSKKKMVDKFGIRGCFVQMDTNLKTEVLNWLDKTDPKNRKPKENEHHTNDTSRDNSDNSEPLKPSKPRRRNSVVSASLFSVNNNVEEHSSDYLQKIQRPCALRMEPIEPTEPVKQVAKKSKIPDLLVLTKNPIASVASIVGVQDAPNQVKSSQSGEIIRCNGNNVSGIPAVPVNGSKKTMVLNNFDPFQRLPNPPFTVRGRVRAQSIDCMRSMPSRRPSLSTIYEHEFECESAEDFEALIYDGISDSSPDETPVEAVEEVQDESHAEIAETKMDFNGANRVNPNMAAVSKWVNRFENMEL